MTSGPQTEIVAGVSVSHRDATIDQIETTASESAPEAVESLLDDPNVTEAFVLQTCNRAEAYVVTQTRDTAREAISSYLGDADREYVREFDHEGSLRHLMSVASGLESLILGEDQILGQLRDAYETARAAGAIGPTLDDAILKAIHVGERARSQTAINEGAVSIGSAAVRFVDQQCDLDGATALVIGAGEIATLAAKALDDPVQKLTIANRTQQNATHLSEQLESTVSTVGLDAVSVAARDADLVVSATGSSEKIVAPETLETAGRTCVIDIAQPRDVDPAVDSLDHIDVFDLDAIETVTDETRATRQRAAQTVESMIDDELEHLLTQYKRKRADQVIAGMYEGAEQIKARELRTAISKLESETDEGVSATEQEILESMADALVGQLLSAPTQSLRDAAENDDWSTISTALQLFGPGFDLDQRHTGTSDEPMAITADMRERISAQVIEQFVEDN